jgi:hypothetical protein
MAERGKPIPFSLREQLKADRQEKTVRQVAAERELSKSTVVKYTKPKQ